MKLLPADHKGLPYKARMLALSLASATVLLIIIYFLNRAGILASKPAIWAAISVFVAAASYEIYLFSLVTRHMMKHLNDHHEKG